MGRCAFCYNATSFFNSKKIVNGTICNSCLKSIPNCFNIDRYDADELQKVQRYESNPKFNDFTVTCELGSLLLDEMHGLFAISSKQNVFSLTDLGEFDIHPAPTFEIAHIFRNIYWAIKRYFFVRKGFLERQRGTQRIAIRIFGLDDANMFFVFDKL